MSRREPIADESCDLDLRSISVGFDVRSRRGMVTVLPPGDPLTVLVDGNTRIIGPRRIVKAQLAELGYVVSEKELAPVIERAIAAEMTWLHQLESAVQSGATTLHGALMAAWLRGMEGGEK